MDYETFEEEKFKVIKDFYRTICYYIRQFFQSVYNLITWFSVIWKDRQWDDYYFFVMLEKKLKRMESFYRSKKARHINALDDADNIHHCLERINRIIKDDYLSEALKVFYSTFPDYDWDLNNKFVERPDGLFQYENNDTPEQKELFDKCCKQSDIDQNNDLDELFAHLRLHIRDWWD